MKTACLLLILSFWALAHAQIRYTTLGLEDDTLYTFAGHLYTGQAVYEGRFYQGRVKIIFKVVAGRIFRQTITYTEDGKVLLSGFYDEQQHLGEVKCISINDSLNAFKTYRNQYEFSELFVHPAGGFKMLDTIIAPNTVVKREYYRNGFVKTTEVITDTAIGTSIIHTENDSTGAITKKTSHYYRNIIVDRLFGGPGGSFIGFYWHIEEPPESPTFKMNIDSSDSSFLKIEFSRYNGGLEDIYWRKGPLSRYDVGFHYVKSKLDRTFRHSKLIVIFSRWDESGPLKKRP